MRTSGQETGEETFWITYDNRALMNERNIAQNELKKNRLGENLKLNYKDLNRQVRPLLTTVRCFSTQLEECWGDSAATWKTLRNVLGP